MTVQFRERALERISSPEQLDWLVKVASPRRWIALAALLLAVVAAILWAAIATVPTTLSGPGFLLPQGGLREVVAPIGGTVGQLDARAGSHVVAGDQVGVIVAADGRRAVVRAPETGVVTEIDSLTHEYQPPGTRLALVEPVGWPLVVYSYVRTQDAAALTRGSAVHVRLGAGISDRYGYVKGRVASVSRYSATPERLSFVLQDPSVVAEIKRLGPANEVVIALDQSAKTPSGLVWSNGSGPRGAPPAGLPASATFIVGSHHPIDDVL
jgi:hypothetical protein